MAKKKTSKKTSSRGGKKLDYRSAGVDIDAGNRFVEYVFKNLKSTYSDRVVEMSGGFAGLFTLENNSRRYRQNFKKPMLVACTDGVGTKLKLAYQMKVHDTVGIDLVAMSVNDMLCVGAQPLFFIDYIGTSGVKGNLCEKILLGVIRGCKESQCALLGGETAEMPDIYQKGEYDLVGFAVGVVEADRVINGEKIAPGDVVIGLPSSGVHSNGFTLARKALFERAGYTPRKKFKALKGKSLGEELLEPTRIYTRAIMKLLHSKPRATLVHGMAHITGGGLVENLPRALPKGCKAVLDTSSWQRPAIFDLIQEAGNVDQSEMYRVFNMGIGFTLVVPKRHQQHALKVLRSAGEKPVVIGEIVKGTKGVKLV